MLCTLYVVCQLYRNKTGQGEMCFTRRLFLIPNAEIIKESAIFIIAEISHSTLLKKKKERMVGHNNKDFSVTHCTVAIITLSLRFVLPAQSFFPPRRGII